jgi:hypothetical protein
MKGKREKAEGGKAEGMGEGGWGMKGKRQKAEGVRG